MSSIGPIGRDPVGPPRGILGIRPVRRPPDGESGKEEPRDRREDSQDEPDEREGDGPHVDVLACTGALLPLAARAYLVRAMRA